MRRGTIMNQKFNHFDQQGNAIMVDVSEKNESIRTAIATGTIHVSYEIMSAIINGTSKKGDVLGVARVAGIMAVKQTGNLIPLCHNLMLQKCNIDFHLDENHCTVETLCTVKTEGKTGVEMEALTGVTVALLTIYDMCKAIDKEMEIGQVHLLQKTGGKSGNFFYRNSSGEEMHK